MGDSNGAQNDQWPSYRQKTEAKGAGLAHELGRFRADTGSATLHSQLSGSTLLTMVQVSSLASPSLKSSY